MCKFSECRVMTNLKDFRVDGIPNTCYYIPNFVTLEEEQSILQNVNKAPKSKWVKLSNRRLQNWGGIPSNGVGNPYIGYPN